MEVSRQWSSASKAESPSLLEQVPGSDEQLQLSMRKKGRLSSAQIFNLRTSMNGAEESPIPTHEFIVQQVEKRVL